MTTDNRVKPFPHDFSVSIKEGVPVYFAWQSLIRNKDSGELYCIVAQTKSAVIRAMVNSGFDLDDLDPAKIEPVAMVNPNAVTTKSAGRISPLDFETSETVDKNIKAIKTTKAPVEKTARPSVAVEEDDDLI